MTAGAFIEPLARIGRHCLGRDMPAGGAGQNGFKCYPLVLRFHSAYPVSMRNPARTGSKTASVYKNPTSPDSPSEVRTAGRIGVKQQSAAMADPAAPILRSLPAIRVVPYSSARCSFRVSLEIVQDCRPTAPLHLNRILGFDIESHSHLRPVLGRGKGRPRLPATVRCEGNSIRGGMDLPDMLERGGDGCVTAILMPDMRELPCCVTAEG